MSLFSRIWSLFTMKTEIKTEENIQTFTYFIPAPPSRKSGYREKNFDTLTHQLAQKGFDILDIKTQSISHGEQPGIYVILKLNALTQEARELKPSDFPQEFTNDSQVNLTALNEHSNHERSIELPKNSDDHDDEVKGIYYID